MRCIRDAPAVRRHDCSVTFIRTLLEAEGDEETVVKDVAERLLGGEPEPASPPHSAVLAVLDDDGASIDLIPSLRELVAQEQWDVRKLTVAAATDARGRIRVTDRHSVFLFDGKSAAV